MLRRRPVELEVNHERWLVSYADFVTLLFGFFVVMYSMSQMHETDYQKLSQALTEVFSITPEDKPSTSTVTTDAPHQVINQPVPADSSTEQVANEQLTPEGENKTYTIAQLPVLEETLTATFADLIDTEQVSVESNEHWLQLTLNNKVLFPLGSVTPSQQARDIMEEIAQILRQYHNPVQVEGFTDNLPINTTQFPSNWELSTARASAIVKLLVAEGVPPQNLAAVGYGKFQPIADNGSAAGRAKNRRVVLMIGREPRPRPQPQAQAKPKPQVKTTEAPEPQSSDSGAGIQPITLENGELLFTTDPDKIKAAEKGR